MNGLLQVGLSNAIAAAVLAAVVAVPAWLLRRRRPAVVHALWLVVMLKLVTPPLWKVPVSWPQEPVPTAPTAAAADATEIDVRTVFVTPEQWETMLATQPAAPASPAPPPTDWAKVATASTMGLWAAGSLVCLTLIVTRCGRFRRLLIHAQPVPPEVRRRAQAIARQFGLAGCPAVVFIPGAVCPMLWAFFGSARLLLPRGLWERLDDAQRDTLIAHELAHLRRRDHWVRLLEVAATVLYWWNPVLWWARRGLREAEEQCCDAWVVWSLPSAVRHYMTAILEAVEFVSEPNREGSCAPPAVPALASGLGEFRRLERRLWMIRRNESPRRLSRAGMVAFVLVAAAALPLAPSLAEDTREIVVNANTDSATPAIAGEVVVLDGAPVTASVEITDTFSVASDAAVSPGGKTITVAEDGGISTIDAASGKTISKRETGKSARMKADDELMSQQETGKSARIKDDDELMAARAEVEKISHALAVARQRLAQLEARAGMKQTVRLKTADVNWFKAGENGRGTIDVPATIKTKPRTTVLKEDWKRIVEPKAVNEPAERLDALEKKLEKIDQLLSEIRDAQGKSKVDKEYEYKRSELQAK